MWAHTKNSSTPPKPNLMIRVALPLLPPLFALDHMLRLGEATLWDLVLGQAGRHLTWGMHGSSVGASVGDMKMGLVRGWALPFDVCRPIPHLASPLGMLAGLLRRWAMMWQHSR